MTDLLRSAEEESLMSTAQIDVYVPARGCWVLTVERIEELLSIETPSGEITMCLMSPPQTTDRLIAIRDDSAEPMYVLLVLCGKEAQVLEALCNEPYMIERVNWTHGITGVTRAVVRSTVPWTEADVDRIVTAIAGHAPREIVGRERLPR